ncbi:hypothetical protein [Streptomyces sp. NPDC004267]|uniref:hypothetical protein n=1 Tax=Streptomyces sp. NPDC004267 TaxID=3364694 RepID=UPI0036812B11
MLGVCLAVLGGVGAWLLSARDTTRPCNGLPGDERVRKSLGAAVRPGMSCSAFGDVLVEATAGREPGIHTRAQAQALKDVLVALDPEGTGTLRVDPALRRPLATALVDYAPDLHAMLGGHGGDHITHAAPGIPPWESDGTAHLAVLTRTLERELRAIAQDPRAYALLRSAETRSAAGRLAAVPADATGYALTVPATEGARALGVLDGVAELVTRSQQDDESRTWRTAVVDGLLDEPAMPGGSRNGQAADLVSAWLRDLRATPEDRRPERLGTQAVDMTRTWTRTRKTDQAVQEDLLDRVRKSQDSGRREATSS